MSETKLFLDIRIPQTEFAWFIRDLPREFLTMPESMALLMLHSRSGKDGRIFPSYASLGSDMKCDPSTAYRTVKSLREVKGWLEVDPGNVNHEANSYHITLPSDAVAYVHKLYAERLQPIPSWLQSAYRSIGRAPIAIGRAPIAAIGRAPNQEENRKEKKEEETTKTPALQAELASPDTAVEDSGFGFIPFAGRFSERASASEEMSQSGYRQSAYSSTSTQEPEEEKFTLYRIKGSDRLYRYAAPDGKPRADEEPTRFTYSASELHWVEDRIVSDLSWLDE